MDYIREAEKYLYHYKDLQYSLKNINAEITKLKWEGAPRDLKGITFEFSGSNKYHDDMINIIYKYKTYVEMKEATEKEIEYIDKLLEDISEENGCENYSQLLKLWYIERLPKEEIAAKLNYSSRTSIYNLREAAIRKFAIRLFGIDALLAV